MFDLKIMFDILAINYENIVVIASILIGFATISKKTKKEIIAFGIFLLLFSIFLHVVAMLFYKSDPDMYLSNSISFELIAQLLCIVSGLLFLDIEALKILEKLARKIQVRVKNIIIAILSILTIYNTISLTLKSYNIFLKPPTISDLYAILTAAAVIGFTYFTAPILAAKKRIEERENS